MNYSSSSEWLTITVDSYQTSHWTWLPSTNCFKRMQSGHGGGSKTKLSKQQRVHCRTTHYWCNIKLDSWLVMHPMPWTMERGSQLLMHPGHLLRKKKKQKKNKNSLTDTSRSNPTINPVQWNKMSITSYPEMGTYPCVLITTLSGTNLRVNTDVLSQSPRPVNSQFSWPIPGDLVPLIDHLSAMNWMLQTSKFEQWKIYCCQRWRGTPWLIGQQLS